MSDNGYDDREWIPEETATFVGPCICEHPIDEHGYIMCSIDDCPCEAHWEE
jgi:hypothetical protein